VGHTLPFVARLFLVVLLVFVLLVSTLWLAQRRLIYFPDRAAVPPAAGAIAGARDVALDTSDGLRLGAWLVPPAGLDRGAAVLVAPGNGSSRRYRTPLANALAREGLTVLLMDYRGYGGNPGSPTEEGLARDARAAYAYLTGTAGFAPDRIVYFGESLGAAVATELATEHPPAGLMLRSPFISLAAVGREHYAFLSSPILLRDRFPVAELIARVTVPTVVAYGTADSIVPARHSQTVAERAGGPVRRIVIDGADHNDAVLAWGSQVIGAVVEFVDGAR
jgi:pimeloyl-ACP methyl ester carboxylesterase